VYSLKTGRTAAGRKWPVLMTRPVRWLTAVLLALASAVAAAGDAPSAAWLRYAPVDAATVQAGGVTPDTLRVLGDDPRLASAGDELRKGWSGMLDTQLRVVRGDARDGSLQQLVLGTADALAQFNRALAPPQALAPEAFAVYRRKLGDVHYLVIAGGDASGVLYGAFALLRAVATEQPLADVDLRQAPSAPIRWTNEWDNPDGSIERGYAGRSIFFDAGQVRASLDRVAGYARLLASVGINGVTINNVNAAPELLDTAHLKQIARIAAAMRPWGIHLSLSIKMNSPQLIGGLPGFDPLDPQVIRWWQDKVNQIYGLIPDFGGVIIKADSEGQPGPSQYGRTPADAANVLARALKPHGGVVMYRGFVYNHHLDWTDPKADRARAGYDNFAPLDGQFDDNVIVQIKYGPIDFQAREPISPLFAGLHKTNVAIELQITQEYTGQQRHLVYLPTMWKQMLDFDLMAEGRRSLVRDIVSGQRFDRPLGGYAGVSNVGLNDYWLAHPLALSNLYGYGRLAWDPRLSAAQIADEWTRLTLGNAPRVRAVTDDLLLDSWHIYEDYTGPLGAGTLTDIIGVHYGPGIESSERNGWGQWHRADTQGIGMERSVATGTGYIGQYPPAVAAQYETLAACPDALLLFMHHVPYSYRLHSGKTVIQHIYDTHYAGAAAAARQVDAWQRLQGLVPADVYAETLRRLRYQAGHAIVWRDAIVNWFHKMSGIDDELGRAGSHPYRHEAERLKLSGYTPVAVTPWETASGGRAVQCAGGDACSATLGFDGAAGRYRIAVQYYDQPQGRAEFTLAVNGVAVDHWVSDDDLPSEKLDGHTATRRTVTGVALHGGDRLSLSVHPDHGDVGALDYLEVIPQSEVAPDE